METKEKIGGEMKERCESVPERFRLLAETIQLIDKIVFKMFLGKENLEVQFARAPDQFSKKTIVAHFPSERSTDGKEYYVVFPFFSEKEIAEAAKKSGRSQNEFLFSTAVHEVRHRVQYHFPSMILFSEKDQERIKDPLVKAVIKGIFQTLEDPEMRRKFEFLFSEYADPHQAMQKELDAIVTGNIAVIFWRKMTAENELPEKKFKVIGNLVTRNARFFWNHTLKELI